jgi:hypothetical protein
MRCSFARRAFDKRTARESEQGVVFRSVGPAGLSRPKARPSLLSNTDQALEGREVVLYNGYTNDIDTDRG